MGIEGWGQSHFLAGGRPWIRCNTTFKNKLTKEQRREQTTENKSKRKQSVKRPLPYRGCRREGAVEIAGESLVEGGGVAVQEKVQERVQERVQ